MTLTELVVCKSSFFSGNTLVRAGDVWAADDPVVRHNAAAFRPLEVHKSRPAVSRPAEAPKRTTRRTS